MPATLKDVAASIGVSTSTVSRAFSRPDLLNDATVSRVRDAAARLGYVVNPVARALITGQSKNLGLIVPDVANPFMTTLLRSVQRLARQQGLSLFVANGDEDPDLERELYQQLSYQTQGIILCAPRMSANDIHACADLAPVVLINRVVRGLASVVIDPKQGSTEAIDHLAELGHRRVAYLPGPALSWANQRRLAQLERGAGQHGLEFVALTGRLASHEDGIAAAPELLASGATAVIAFDDLLALGLIEGLSRRRKQVPRDVSVIGYDDVLASLARPALTTVAGSTEDTARTAVELLAGQTGAGGTSTDGSHAVPPAIRLPSSLVVRGSTGRPR